jgi:hypothetical protein
MRLLLETRREAAASAAELDAASAEAALLAGTIAIMRVLLRPQDRPDGLTPALHRP